MLLEKATIVRVKPIEIKQWQDKTFRNRNVWLELNEDKKCRVWCSDKTGKLDNIIGVENRNDINIKKADFQISTFKKNNGEYGTIYSLKSYEFDNDTLISSTTNSYDTLREMNSLDKKPQSNTEVDWLELTKED